jgi:lysozyme family protein
MASFEVAFNWTMDNEDRGREYKTVPDAPPGAHAISGINSAAFPSDFERIDAIPQANRAPAVESFYRLRFWSPWLEQLRSDELAKRVFDAEFNMGEGTGVKILQRAVESVSGVSVGVDGIWGPATLHGANTCDADRLTETFKTARCQHYRDIVLKNPASGVYLNAWLARAGK